MLTAIGRAATQRLLLRVAPLAGPRTQPVVCGAGRGFSTSQWARMPATKASLTTTKTKKSTEATKDGAATKKKKATAKTKTKTKAATKPKKEKKSVPKKRVVKVLTPEEKQKLDVRKWKKLALLPDPKKLPTNKWLVYVTEETKGSESPADLMNGAKERGESFRNLTSYELQRLQDKVDENKLINNATYKAWVESHTPQAVAEANRARMHLRKARGRSIPAPIRDDRQPTHPPTSYALFVKARWASGDFASLSFSEATSRMSEEWKELSEPEKSTYRDLSKAERDRYARDSLSVLGHVVRPRETSE